MEPESEEQFSKILVPEVKVEYGSDTSDCESEEKWNADSLVDGTIVNDVSEVCMPVIEEEEDNVKVESSECANNQDKSKLEEEKKSLTESNNEDVSRMSIGVSSPACSNIIPTLQNPMHEYLQRLCKVSTSSNVCNSERTKTKQTNAERGQNKRPYTCTICSKSFTRRDHLTVHLCTHTNHRPFNCSVCNKSFVQNGDLRKHLRTHTNDRPYMCNICSKSFTQNGDLRRHMRTHTNERPYICKICNKSFIESGHLTKHVRTHTNERPHTCSVCNKSFIEIGNLKKHQRTHTNERPYACNICTKSFSDSGDLRKHERIHTNERPYTCNICNKSFTRSGNLNVHQRTHRND